MFGQKSRHIRDLKDTIRSLEHDKWWWEEELKNYRRKELEQRKREALKHLCAVAGTPRRWSEEDVAFEELSDATDSFMASYFATGEG